MSTVSRFAEGHRHPLRYAGAGHRTAASSWSTPSTARPSSITSRRNTDSASSAKRRESERKKIEAEGIREFQTIVSQGISDSYLRWRGIEATLQLAQSTNTKIVIIGSAKDGLPLILGNMDTPPAQSTSLPAPHDGGTPSKETTVAAAAVPLEKTPAAALTKPTEKMPAADASAGASPRPLVRRSRPPPHRSRRAHCGQ